MYKYCQLDVLEKRNVLDSIVLWKYNLYKTWLNALY